MIFLLTGRADAQTALSYRARVTFESQQIRTAAPGPLTTRGASWDPSHLFIAAADSTWDRGGRLKFAGGLLASGASGTGASATAREAYARFSASPWMDIEAGKRLVRWGVGYGFSPTGVLDPPRRPTDPTDRLGRNEGMALARVDVFAGGTSLTLAAADAALWREDANGAAPARLVAARLRTVLRGGMEVAFIGAAAADRHVSFGANFTHVAGQRLEWHGELLVDGGEDREIRGVAGLQYTRHGVNVVLEYHRNRADILFVRAARAAADARLVPEIIVSRSLDDRSLTLVAGLGWIPRQRFEVYARATHIAGSARSGLPRSSSTISLGTTLKF